MQFSLVARLWRWEKDNIELAIVWVWKSYYKSSNFVSISCVSGFEMEHKFHKTCAWGLMLLCPSKIGFVQGSTSVVCCVVIYFLLLRVIGRYLRIPIHKKKNGDIKIYNTNTCKDAILIVVYFAKLLLNCITWQITLFLQEDPWLLADPYSFFPSALAEAFFFFIVYYYTSCPI